MAGIPSRMNQSAREQILSTDLNRIGNLAGRELMDAELARSVRADFYAPATNAFDDFSAGARAGTAVTMSGLTAAPSLDGIPASFDMSLGAGEGHLPGVEPNPDLSGNQLARWTAQRVTWPISGTPDPTNARICLICATPTDVLADVTSRNILLDPSSRVVSPQNVYKTSNPVAVISVVVGTAAAAPVFPAVPAGALALFAVYVPALSADSTSFLPVRMAWRRIEFPGTSQHGIVKGCVPNVKTSGASLDFSASIVHRIVLDGELLTFQGNGSTLAKSDTIAPPTMAPGGNDKPYYLYLCGGRNQPALNYSYVVPGWKPVPVYLVISATAPDALGYPKAGLAINTPTLVFPRAACCYLGLAFYGAGGTTNVPAFYEGDWIYSDTTNLVKGFKQTPISLPANTYTAFTLQGIPASSTVMELLCYYQSGSTDYVALSTANTGSGLFGILQTIVTTRPQDTFRQRLPVTDSIWYQSTNTTGTLAIQAAGFNMGVPRLAR